MLYHGIYINEITAVKGLGYFNKVLAVRLRPENPFTDTLTVCLGVFLLLCSVMANMLDFESSDSGSIPGRASKISGLKRFHPGCLNKVYEKSEIQIERVKEFSPEMDFFSSSTVMPQRDLTGQDYLLITPLVIFKPFKVSQERKR